MDNSQKVENGLAQTRDRKGANKASEIHLDALDAKREINVWSPTNEFDDTGHVNGKSRGAAIRPLAD